MSLDTTPGMGPETSSSSPQDPPAEWPSGRPDIVVSLAANITAAPRSTWQPVPLAGQASDHPAAGRRTSRSSRREDHRLTFTRTGCPFFVRTQTPSQIARDQSIIPRLPSSSRAARRSLRPPGPGPLAEAAIRGLEGNSERRREPPPSAAAQHTHDRHEHPHDRPTVPCHHFARAGGTSGSTARPAPTAHPAPTATTNDQPQSNDHP
jgi:hypothetical protein